MFFNFLDYFFWWVGYLSLNYLLWWNIFYNLLGRDHWAMLRRDFWAKIYLFLRIFNYTLLEWWCFYGWLIFLIFWDKFYSLIWYRWRVNHTLIIINRNLNLFYRIILNQFSHTWFLQRTYYRLRTLWGQINFFNHLKYPFWQYWFNQYLLFNLFNIISGLI